MTLEVRGGARGQDKAPGRGAGGPNNLDSPYCPRNEKRGSGNGLAFHWLLGWSSIGGNRFLR